MNKPHHRYKQRNYFLNSKNVTQDKQPKSFPPQKNYKSFTQKCVIVVEYGMTKTTMKYATPPTISARLRIARLASGLSQQQLADAAKMDQQQLSRIERPDQIGRASGSA